ncbi:hypothetical protein, partial [Bacillus xiamenensis]|uniref:hypothetical protein n=1 Tax=Bacillus xiamenensis TaxID=1178537 RepID=UPI00028E53C2
SQQPQPCPFLIRVLNDQRPQVLPSGQNIHVRFACLYHTMIHSGKKVPFLSVFSRLKAQQTQKTLKGIKPIKVFDFLL